MNLIRNYRNWRRFRETVNELDRLSNRELSDLGISRSDIPSSPASRSNYEFRQGSTSSQVPTDTVSFHLLPIADHTKRHPPNLLPRRVLLKSRAFAPSKRRKEFRQSLPPPRR